VDEALARNSMAVEMRGEASVIFVYFQFLVTVNQEVNQ
jgi:hypothetical protein